MQQNNILICIYKYIFLLVALSTLFQPQVVVSFYDEALGSIFSQAQKIKKTPHKGKRTTPFQHSLPCKHNRKAAVGHNSESKIDKLLRKEAKKFQEKLNKRDAMRESKIAENDKKQQKSASPGPKQKKTAAPPWKQVVKAPFGKDMTAPIKRSWHVDDIERFEFVGGFSAKVPNLKLPEVAFLGRSNVGKSSLLNTLQGGAKKIAKVSKIPGRTQMINIFKACNRAGEEVLAFADLPGYGFAKISQEVKTEISDFLSKYFDTRETLKCAILLLDIRREPQDSDMAIVDFLEEAGIPTIVVATKVDKLTSAEVQQQLQVLKEAFGLPEGLPLPFSAVTGTGRNELWQTIREACNR